MIGLVSIVIPIFNRADVLPDTFKSLQQQTYKNWQAILVDDGSTDNAVVIMQEWAANDSRFMVVQKSENKKGAPSSRNAGLQAATGEYILFLDSDDLLIYDCLEKRVAVLQQNLAYDFALFNGAFFTHTLQDADTLWNKFDERNDVERFLSGEPVWQTTGPLWRKSFLQKQGLLFDETLATSQDWDFHVRALLKNPSYKKIEDLPDYFIRRTPGIDRISDGHWTEEKIYKRINLYINTISTYLHNNEWSVYQRNLLKMLLRHLYFIQYNHSLFIHKQTLHALKPLLHHYKLIVFWWYLQIGNELLDTSRTLYVVYRKFFSLVKVGRLINYPTKYRTKMTEVEILFLQKKLLMHG